MLKTNVELIPLKKEEKEQFILSNQAAFKFGAVEEFGLRDNHFNDDGEVISKETIEKSIDNPKSVTFKIVANGKSVGGVILRIDKNTNHNFLDILFVSPSEHSKGIGYGAWLEVEKKFPETKIRETCTPYFDKRNIHFYINKCGFHATEFWCEFNKENNLNKEGDEGPDEMFKFIKVMK